MALAIEVFGKEGCAKCKAAKDKFTHYVEKHSLDGRVRLVFHDMATVDGMAEGAFRDVFNIPTTIVSDDQAVLGRWEGTVPTTEEFEKSIHAQSQC